jgi:hypothetical protein
MSDFLRDLSFWQWMGVFILCQYVIGLITAFRGNK